MYPELLTGTAGGADEEAQPYIIMLMNLSTDFGLIKCVC